MRVAISLLAAAALIGCSEPSDATADQLTDAIESCGIAEADVRIRDGHAAWFWAYKDGVHDNNMTCVRDALADQNLKANFFDRSITDEVGK